MFCQTEAGISTVVLLPGTGRGHALADAFGAVSPAPAAEGAAPDEIQVFLVCDGARDVELTRHLDTIRDGDHLLLLRGGGAGRTEAEGDGDERPLSFYKVAAVLGTSSLAWLTFLMPPQPLSDRLHSDVMLLLAFIAVKAFVDGFQQRGLPDALHRVSLLDRLVLCHFGFLLLVTAEHGLAAGFLKLAEAPTPPKGQMDMATAARHRALIARAEAFASLALPFEEWFLLLALPGWALCHMASCIVVWRRKGRRGEAVSVGRLQAAEPAAKRLPPIAIPKQCPQKEA